MDLQFKFVIPFTSFKKLLVCVKETHNVSDFKIAKDGISVYAFDDEYDVLTHAHLRKETFDVYDLNKDEDESGDVIISMNTLQLYDKLRYISPILQETDIVKLEKEKASKRLKLVIELGKYSTYVFMVDLVETDRQSVGWKIPSTFYTCHFSLPSTCVSELCNVILYSLNTVVHEILLEVSEDMIKFSVYDTDHVVVLVRKFTIPRCFEDYADHIGTLFEKAVDIHGIEDGKKRRKRKHEETKTIEHPTIYKCLSPVSNTFNVKNLILMLNMVEIDSRVEFMFKEVFPLRIRTQFSNWSVEHFISPLSASSLRRFHHVHQFLPVHHDEGAKCDHSDDH